MSAEDPIYYFTLPFWESVELICPTEERCKKSICAFFGCLLWSLKIWGHFIYITDVLMVLSERTLQNMPKLTWARKRAVSLSRGEKEKAFLSFPALFLFVFICGYILLYGAPGIKTPICRREHKHLKMLFMYLRKSNSRTQVSDIWNESINWSKCTSVPDNDIFALFRFTSDADYWQGRNISGLCLRSGADGSLYLLLSLKPGEWVFAMWLQW